MQRDDTIDICKTKDKKKGCGGKGVGWKRRQAEVARHGGTDAAPRSCSQSE